MCKDVKLQSRASHSAGQALAWISEMSTLESLLRVAAAPGTPRALTLPSLPEIPLGSKGPVLKLLRDKAVSKLSTAARKLYGDRKIADLQHSLDNLVIEERDGGVWVAYATGPVTFMIHALITLMADGAFHAGHVSSLGHMSMRAVPDSILRKMLEDTDPEDDESEGVGPAAQPEAPAPETQPQPRARMQPEAQAQPPASNAQAPAQSQAPAPQTEPEPQAPREQPQPAAAGADIAGKQQPMDPMQQRLCHGEPSGLAARPLVSLAFYQLKGSGCNAPKSMQITDTEGFGFMAGIIMLLLVGISPETLILDGDAGLRATLRNYKFPPGFLPWLRRCLNHGGKGIKKFSLEVLKGRTRCDLSPV